MSATAYSNRAAPQATFTHPLRDRVIQRRYGRPRPDLDFGCGQRPTHFTAAHMEQLFAAFTPTRHAVYATATMQDNPGTDFRSLYSLTP